MSTTDTGKWHHTSPLAAIFYLGKIYRAIAKNAVQSLAPLAAFLVAYQGDLLGKITIGGGGFVAITVISSIVRYWFFRYRIEDSSILIREGIIRKTQLDIKFDRIQGINTEQNVLFRAFDLVTVKFDTAGSATQEGHLPAIKTALADSLKAQIRHKSRGFEIDSQTEVENDQRETIEPILRLDARDMIRIGLSSNRALVLLVLLGPIIERLSEDLEENIDETAIASAAEAGQFALNGSLSLALLIVFGFLLVLAVASIIGAFLRYHKFVLVSDKDVLRSNGGLLTRHEHAVNFAKIQMVFTVQNPVLRLFRRYRLQARQASSGRPGRDKHVDIPLAEPDQLPVIAGQIFRDEFHDVDLSPESGNYRRISARYVRSRVMLTGILPALALTALMSPATGFYALVILLWVPLNAFIVWVIYRKYGYRVTDDGMMLRRGFLGSRVVAFALRKVQRVTVRQSLPQHRNGLATLRFYLASGSIKLPYIDFEVANGLRDYALYKVESSQQAWH